MFVQFRGLLKVTNGKNWAFCFEIYGRNETMNGYGCSKTLSSNSMETKNVTKNRKLNPKLINGGDPHYIETGPLIGTSAMKESNMNN